MARKISIPYNEIMAKYKTGQYSISQLAKDYGVGKSRISEYIKNNNVTISEHAQHAIKSLDEGFSSLNKIISEQVSEHSKDTLTKDITYKNNNTLIVDEVIKIVRQRNPQFVHAFQSISAKILKLSNNLLDNGISDTKDLKNITSAMKDINDTLQVIPKPPAFAQQININKESNNNKELVKTIEVEIVGHENTNS